MTFAQFVMLQPLPGTLDFNAWEKSLGDEAPKFGGVPLTRYWLIPPDIRPRVYMQHPVMGADEIRRRTQSVWDRFYSTSNAWRRSRRTVKSLKARLAFLLISKIYRQMYANTGIATDSARVQRSAFWARWLARGAHRLFMSPPMPALREPRQARRRPAKHLPVITAT